MVSTTSAATQANESEKRRKQTLERAKANHLSRQLQMRLQYARLKVDYGWQKQNLNEVENLYFHHSHLRGPRPQQSTSLLTTPTLRDPVAYSTSPPNPIQSSLSFKLGPSTLPRGATAVSLNDGTTMGDANSGTTTTPPPLPLTFDPTSSGSDATPHSQNLSSLISMEIDQDEKRAQTPTPLPGTLPASVTTSPYLDHHSIFSNTSKSPFTPYSPGSLSTPWAPASMPTTNHYPKAAQRTQSHPHSTSTSNSSGDPYGFGSSSLTYDSFWSSHSAATGSRPFRGSTGNALADARSGGLLGAGDLGGPDTNGIGDASILNGDGRYNTTGALQGSGSLSIGTRRSSAGREG